VNTEPCFHCGLEIGRGVQFYAVIDGASRAMCCAGCVAVAELIANGGFTAYYRFRDAPADNPQAVAKIPSDQWARYDDPSLQKSFVRFDDGDLRCVTLSIEGLRCAACVWLLESHLRAQRGIDQARVHLGAGRAEVAWHASETSLSVVLAAMAALGYVALPYRPDWEAETRAAEYRAALRRLVVGGLGATQVMMYAVGLYAGALQGMEDRYRFFLRVTSAMVATPVLFYAGRPFLAGAWRDLRNRRLGMDVPVSVALLVAWSASLWATVTRSGEVYFDSVSMFVFFLSLGRFVEMRARQRACAAIEAALRQPPASATKIDADGSRRIVAASELAAGDRIVVRPGETFPVDGAVCDGRGWVNESMLTGEHWPCEKNAGDDVAAGTQNGESPLVVVATRTGADTAWSRIVRMVDAAGEARPRLARLADRVAQIFVPAVLAIAAGTAIVWAHIDASRAFWVALSVLVVTCPCALSLATPAALTAASRGALRRGLLLRNGAAIESLRRVTHVVFDKTGTLTLGRFRRRRTVALAGLDEASCLALAAALEGFSEHPLARAFDDVDASSVVVQGICATAGAGIEGHIDGRRVRIGSASWVSELCGVGAGAAGALATGGTAIALGDERGLLCRFELEDVPRPHVARTIASLRRAGLRVVLASGDGRASVAAVAASAGIDEWIADSTPADKLALVKSLQAHGAVVLMVGDGVNDAPVLGAADVSIAMGTGTDLARSRADAVLIGNDLGAIEQLLVLARRTRRVMRENLVWSGLYNLLAIPLACSGLVAPWMAAVGMSASSLVVVLNAVRLGDAPRAGERIVREDGAQVVAAMAREAVA
jgi:Cu2+-exporting ATPase